MFAFVAGFYTLNDHTQRDCIRITLQAYKRLGDGKYYLNVARKGGDFLVLARLPEPQPGWAQPYNFDLVKSTQHQIAKALIGDYRAEHLFQLKT